MFKGAVLSRDRPTWLF